MNNQNNQEIINRAEHVVKVLVRAIFGVDPVTKASIDDLGINIEIVGPESHMGQLMGKGSKNIQALRQMMFVWGSINCKRLVNVAIPPRGKTAA